MQVLGDPITNRYKEYTVTLPEAFSIVRAAISEASTLATSKDPKYDHIEQSERNKVIEECTASESFLLAHELTIKNTPKTHSSPVNPYEIKRRKDQVDRIAREVMGKAKPKPPEPKPEPKPAEAKPAEAKPAESKPAEQKTESSATHTESDKKTDGNSSEPRNMEID